VKEVDRQLFFYKVKSFGIDSCLYEIPKNVGSMIWSCGHRSRTPMCTVTSSSRRKTSLGKIWKHTTLWFSDGSSHYRCWSAILLIIPAMCSPSFVVKSGQASALITSRTVCGLCSDGRNDLIVCWYDDSALWHNFSLCVWLSKIYEMYEHWFRAFLT